MDKLPEKLPFCVAKVKKELYDSCNFQLKNFCLEEESTEYEACSFQLEVSQIICRTAKITPKKVGQFVTIWKRNAEGITAPFHEADRFDFIVINVQKEEKIGQFVFPKSVLIQKRIVATDLKDGKRGIRVYPSWDTPTSKQAIKTQVWQLGYFFMLHTSETASKARLLYADV